MVFSLLYYYLFPSLLAPLTIIYPEAELISVVQSTGAVSEQPGRGQILPVEGFLPWKPCPLQYHNDLCGVPQRNGQDARFHFWAIVVLWVALT